MPPETSEQLDAALTGGQEELVERLWTRVQATVARTVREKAGRSLLAGREADDLAQECLAAVVRDLRQFRYLGSGSLEAWVRKVTENALRMLGRSDVAQKRGRALVAAAAPEQIEAAKGPRQKSQSTPSGESAKRELLRRLQQATALLSPLEAKMVQEVDVVGRPIREVAAELGVAERTLFRARARALRRLARFLGPA